MKKVFLTVPQLPKHKQITFEDMLAGITDLGHYVMWSPTGTITRYVNASAKLENAKVIPDMLKQLRVYMEAVQAIGLFDCDLHDHYKTFHVPKRSGGLRKICAPDEILSGALRMLGGLFTEWMPATYHTSAFAYINGRSTVDERKRHQSWDSKWYGYFDFHDFFGSTTKEFVMKMLGMIYPFNFIVRYSEGKQNLEKALDLAFLDGGLPQGTPLSPLLTNIIMIPFDHIMTQKLHHHTNPRAKDGYDRFIYTRYADDISISCRNEFDVEVIQQLILDTLGQLGAKFTLNTSKTKYQSRNGKNFHLGVIINQENNITLGHQKKRRIKAMVSNYIMDKKNEVMWDVHDVQILNGQLAYYNKVEADSCKEMVNKFNNKYDVDLMKMVHEDLKNSEENV